MLCFFFLSLTFCSGSGSGSLSFGILLYNIQYYLSASISLYILLQIGSTPGTEASYHRVVYTVATTS